MRVPLNGLQRDAVAARSAEYTRQGSNRETADRGGWDAADVKRSSTCTMFTREDILAAMTKASKGHMHKGEVRRMLADRDNYCTRMLADITDGSYRGHIAYRQIMRTGNNGKTRRILSPSLYTRVLQIAWMNAVIPAYNNHDNLTGLNCKQGCGITASTRSKSVLHLAKHLMYDRRDLHYGLMIDQRKCYEHITRRVFRRKMKHITRDRWLIDFGTSVVFTPDGQFPIGTPSSPLAHHIIMLDFDHRCRTFAPVVIRYADNILLASPSKAELQAAKWRIKNWWWYDLGIRAKRQDTRIFPLSEGIDFCGYRLHRNPDRRVTDHNKGYTTLRRSTCWRIKKCNNNQSWASYYGQMKAADCHRLMTETEQRMKLTELSSRIRIDRKMDARRIDVRELADSQTVFTIYDYEIRRDKEGRANWLKCLIGFDEVADGTPTGRIAAREFHGNYSCLIDAIEAWENAFGRTGMLPIEEVQIENQCGFIFRGSTNQIQYIDEYEYQQSDCA